MERIKLTDAGSSVVIQVARVETNTAGKWPDYELVAADGRVVVIPKTAADRQLQRINVASVQELVGSFVKVSRSDTPGDNGKLFWNLGIVNAAAANAAPSKRLPPPEKQGISMGRVPGLDNFPDEEYGASVHSPSGPDDDSPYDNPGPIPPFHKTPSRAAEVAPNAADRMKVAREYLDLLAWVKTQPETKGMSDEAVQASAATIWIQWGRKGLA